MEFSLAALEYSDMPECLASMQRLMDALIDEDGTIEKVEEAIEHFFSEHDPEYYGSSVIYAILYVSQYSPKLYRSYESFAKQIIDKYNITDIIYPRDSILYDVNPSLLTFMDTFKESTDPIRVAIRNDDIEEVKKIIFSRLNFDFSKENYMSCICYFGAVKCFKYFLLNGGHIFSNTQYMAICSGNEEIIYMLMNNCNQKFTQDDFVLSIIFHRYAITDWLYEQGIGNYGRIYDDILIHCYNFRAVYVTQLLRFPNLFNKQICFEAYSCVRYCNLPYIVFILEWWPDDAITNATKFYIQVLKRDNHSIHKYLCDKFGRYLIEARRKYGNKLE